MFEMLANQRDRDAKDLENASLIEEIIAPEISGPHEQTPIGSTYAVYKDGHALTYLPDPIAEEVAVRFFDHPNIDDKVIPISLYPSL